MHPYTYRLFVLSALWMIMGRIGLAAKARSRWKQLLSRHIEDDEIMNNWFIEDADLHDPRTEQDKEFKEWLANRMQEPLTTQEQKIVDEAETLMRKKGLLN